MLNKKQQQEMHTHYSIDMKAALNRTFRWVVKKTPKTQPYSVSSD